MHAPTDDELQAMEARCEAATPGPWRSWIEGSNHQSGSSFIQTGRKVRRGPDIELTGATAADQDFIANARQDLPRLLQEVHRLRAEVVRGSS